MFARVQVINPLSHTVLHPKKAMRGDKDGVLVEINLGRDLNLSQGI
jgi:hypothetical protein